MSTITINYKEIIKNGENLSIEFKSDRKLLSDSDIYDNVIGLINTQGGYLLIGVENDGTISGLNKERKPNWFNKIETAIRNNTNPPIDVKCFKVLEENIFILQVPPAKGIIYYNSKGVCYHRVLSFKGPELIPMQFHQQISKLSRMGKFDVSTQFFTDASFDDLDPIEFIKLKKIIQKNSPSDSLLTLSNEDIAKGLGFVSSNNEGIMYPTLLGLLMVGKESSITKYIPTHEVAFQVTDEQLNPKVNRFYRNSILSILEDIETLFNAYNKEKEIMIGFQRIPIPDYSVHAFREAILNALVHRDYSLNQSIYIQLYPDELKISSPGGFVEGIMIDNFLTHEPKPRNPQLANICQRIGLVERLGRGIDKIFIEQLRLGRCAPDYSTSNYEAVRVILSGGEANLNFVKFVIENNILNLGELLILSHLQDVKRIDLKDASKLIQEPENRTRKFLETLVSKNLIEAKGEKSGRIYTLSSWVYKELEILDEYIHTRNFEPIQHETMVLQYLDRYGSMKRIDVESLCRIKTSTAKNLLQSLIKKELINRTGQGKNIVYIKK